MIGKIWDNPRRIILNNPGTNQMGKRKTFRPFPPVGYLSKIFRKMEDNRPHIPTGNMVVLALSIRQIFQGVFKRVTTAD
jgi:hypothetical protein